MRGSEEGGTEGGREKEKEEEEEEEEKDEVGRYLGARSWGALLWTPSTTALPRCRRRMRKGWRMRKGLDSVVSACDGQRERTIERNREKRERKRDNERAHAHSCFTPLVDNFPNHLAHNK